MVEFSQNEKIRTIEAARKALETIEEARSCSKGKGPRGIKKLKGFDKKDMKKKAQKDATFFEHLYDEVIASSNPAARAAYEKLITEAMVLAGQILQEADVAPRTVSPIVDNQVLSESEVVEYYKRAFNLILEEKFNKPNLKSKLLYEHIDVDGDGVGDLDIDVNENGCVAKRIVAPGIKGVIIKCVKNGVLDNNDPEAVAKYLSAENAVRDAISNILIPQRVMQQIEDYQNSLPEGYEEIFGNSLNEKIEAFKQSVAKIAAIVAPFIFTKALKDANIDVPFNPAQVAGIGLDCQN